MANNIGIYGQKILSAKDIPNGALGKVTFEFENGDTMDGMFITELSFTSEHEKVDLRVLGSLDAVHKKVGTNGTFSITMYDCTTKFRKLEEQYQDTGIDQYFTCKVVQEDPGTDLGRQSITYFNCNVDEIVCSQLNVDAEALTVELSGTYEKFKINEEYKILDGLFE